MNHSPLFDEFEAEIYEVQGTLLAATTELRSPLGDLVRAQIKRSQPPICAAVVLAVAKPLGDSDLRRKRILLAAALEMLHIALNVHRLLVNAAVREQNGGGEDTLDRAFIGSTILAGDYCFSRAAQMAAQTDHARVVATFSLALQAVSEGLLREQFNPNVDNGNSQRQSDGTGSGSYNETRQLLQSGAQAAAQLVDLPEAEQQEAIALSQELALHWQPQTLAATAEGWQPQTMRATPLPSSWQALHHWLKGQYTNGEPLSSSQRSYR